MSSVYYTVIVYLILLGCRANSPRLAAPRSSSKTTEDDSHSRVAVINGVGFHTEVYCALLWAFTQAGAIPTAFVLKEATGGIEHVISEWYTKAFQPYADFQQQACAFNVVAMATFPEHHLDMANALADRACPGQRFVLVVHNPHGLESNGAKALLSRVDAWVLTLAPHTMEIASKAVHFMDLPQVPPGLFQSQRRNYRGLFDDVARSKELTRSPHFTLRLIGKGDLAIPAALKSKVTKETNLPYEEYYRAIQQALLVLPAFSSNAYYTTKASSSVAAAIICGTPLLGDQQLLDAYSYLTAPAVYLQRPGESDAAAMARLLSTPADEVAERRRAIEELRKDLYMLNGEVINDILVASTVKK